jgi:hypothetical protein
MYQCATVCESIRVKSAKNAFFFQRTNDTRFDDCTNTPGFPIRRLPSSPDFSSRKKKRKHVLWSSGGELMLADGKQTLTERLTVKHH